MSRADEISERLGCLNRSLYEDDLADLSRDEDLGNSLVYAVLEVRVRFIDCEEIDRIHVFASLDCDCSIEAQLLHIDKVIIGIGGRENV